MKGHFRKRRIKGGLLFSVLGILLMLSTMAAIYFWETKGRKDFLYSPVVVLNQDVEAGTAITPDMIRQAKLDPGNMIEGAITREEKIAGKVAAQYIPKNSQLALAYFKDEAQEGEKIDSYIFAVDPEWIITFPSSLRRGDTVYFYPVRLESDKEQNDRSIRDLESIKITDISGLFKAEVAYLKDSGNREVVDTEGEQRYDASANIASIEIITDFQDVSYLKELAQGGWKFIILYRDN